MLISTSSEFVALAREQMILLTQSLGASLSIVYLAQELVEAQSSEAKLIPIVAYPEKTVIRKNVNNLALPKLNQKLLAATQELTIDRNQNDSNQSHQNEDNLFNGDQVVLPLIHENMMIGLLVTVREDRPWEEKERREVERIAGTLAIACVLDRRRGWLEQQLQQQQILQERQQDLLDTLLHQLRNPITALRTFGKLLFKRFRPGDANSEVAASIIRESDRLKELLQKFDEILDLAPSDLIQPQLSPKEVLVAATVTNNEDKPLLLPGSGEEEVKCDISEILNPLLVSIKAIALERNLKLVTFIPSQIQPVRANVKALTEVLSNIIDNSLKYTPSGGEIVIRAGKHKANFLGIAISDNGPGIPEEDLEHLGERHYRGVQAKTDIPGTGLGLAIAKQLIEKMHGEIEAFSPALSTEIESANSKGTTFIIWLPIY
ncbi:MAG: HAMP domain-containing sensor histidine kinase [Cyanobacteria bacterium P01_A01_bin.84]